MNERTTVLWLRRVAGTLMDALEKAEEVLPEEAFEEREVRNAFVTGVVRREAPALDALHDEVAAFRREIAELEEQS